LAHVHNLPGQIDITAEVLVVCGDRVLLRVHDKLGIWLSVGGHVELDEDPVEAAVREVAEEVGLKVTIDDSHMTYRYAAEGHRELVPPVFVCRTRMSATHEHVTLTYFARSETTEVVPSGDDRSDTWHWFSRAELEDPSYDLLPNVAVYAAAALDRCGATRRERAPMNSDLVPEVAAPAGGGQ
jgi:8-oxo-dGTP pyrophosphatase MutT (NUDIX family)